MARFREQIGLRQSADDWLKSINNINKNLQSQGLSAYAKENIENMRSMGFDIIKDKNGNDIIARSRKNQELYKSLPEEMTKGIRQNVIYDVRKAKQEEENRKRREQNEEDDENDEPEDIGDAWDEIDDYYELAQTFVKEWNNLLAEAWAKGINVPMYSLSLHEALSMMSNGIGGRGQLDMYRDIIRNEMSGLRQMVNDLEHQ
jgi:hypothetical protein